MKCDNGIINRVQLNHVQGRKGNTVVQKILGKIPDRLPLQGTLHCILNEAKVVA